MTATYECPSKYLPRIAIKFDHRGEQYTVIFGRFDDGRPAELFLDGPANFDMVTKMASVALQHGAPIEALRGAVIGGPLAKAFDHVIAACIQ
jgi:hypothetical protein